MKNQTILISRILCFMLLGYCVLWSIGIVLAFLTYTNLIEVELIGFNIVPLRWIEDSSSVAFVVQWIEMIGYLLSSVIMITILLIFITKLLKGFKSDQVFTRSNMQLLYVLAAASFFFELFQMNKHIISGVRQIVFTSDMFIMPTLVLFVAMLYNLAVKAAEENKLTI